MTIVKPKEITFRDLEIKFFEIGCEIAKELMEEFMGSLDIPIPPQGLEYRNLLFNMIKKDIFYSIIMETGIYYKISGIEA